MTIAELQRGQRVRWRGETVQVVALGHRRVQILRPGGALRWVGAAQLEAL